MSESPNTPTKPDWRKWSLIREPRLWEAVALSLDVDPDRFAEASAPTFGVSTPRTFEARDALVCLEVTHRDELPDWLGEFRLRLEVVSGDYHLFAAERDDGSTSHERKVSLVRLSAWLRTSTNWPVPREFPESIATPDWEHWRLNPSPRLWEAVALTCDLDPDSRIVELFLSDKNDRRLEQLRLFGKRLRTAESNVDKFSRDHSGRPPSLRHVEPEPFVAWVRDAAKWPVPRKFFPPPESGTTFPSWPWGDLETPDLRALREMVREYPSRPANERTAKAITIDLEKGGTPNIIARAFGSIVVGLAEAASSAHARREDDRSKQK